MKRIITVSLISVFLIFGAAAQAQLTPVKDVEPDRQLLMKIQRYLPGAGYVSEHRLQRRNYPDSSRVIRYCGGWLWIPVE